MKERRKERERKGIERVWKSVKERRKERERKGIKRV